MTEFTPIQSLIGGALLGLSSVLLMASHGRIAGISGIAVRIFPPYLDTDATGRAAFILGLVISPAIFSALTGGWAQMTITGSSTLLAIAGLLVGFGAVWGNGCTSGHGICGLARLSVRSFVAVAVFMAAAIVTVYVMRHAT